MRAQGLQPGTRGPYGGVDAAGAGELQPDLGDAAQRAQVETRLREDAGITLLVNNAGIGTPAKLLESDVEQMTRLIELNVTALTRLTYAAVPAFVARGKPASS